MKKPNPISGVTPVFLDKNGNQVNIYERLTKLHKAQQECLERKNIDWDKMSRTYITI